MLDAGGSGKARSAVRGTGGSGKALSAVRGTGGSGKAQPIR